MHLEFRTLRDRRTSRASRRNRQFEAEILESRQLLSGSTANLANLTATPSIAASTTVPLSQVQGLTPSEIATAYNFSSTDTGAGQTIAIVDAYNDPNIATDLANFSAEFGLPAANLKVVNQTGGSQLPANNASWSQEIALDVEWAHAAAPSAKILLVEASSANLSDLVTAVQTAAKSANVVSMSWGGSEFFGENQLNSIFNVPGVTFVASAGDTPGASWPAVSPNVVGVGGTSLTLNSSGGYGSESVWNSTGGGISALEPAPSYQLSYNGLLGVVPTRVSPDVGFDANPSTGVAVLDTYQNPSSANGWFQVGGTSAGAPQWAGIFADANALRGSSVSTTTALTDLYNLANNPTTAAKDFHQVTAGDAYFLNTQTGTTFSLGTGLGTPNVANLVAGLAGTSTTTTSGTTGGGNTGGTTGTGTTTGGTTGTGTTGGGTTGTGTTGGGTTGGGHTGGRQHHPFSDVNTLQVILSPVTTPATPLGGSLGAVTNATSNSGSTASVAVSQAITVAVPSTTSNLARPVQPVASALPRLISSSNDMELAAERAAVEAGAGEEQPQAPAAPPQAPNAPPALENAAPQGDKAPTPMPDEIAPAQNPLSLESWDDVLADLDGDARALAPLPVATSRAASEEETSSQQAALAVSAAVIAWGSWEVRSRLGDRRSRRSFFKRSGR